MPRKQYHAGIYSQQNFFYPGLRSLILEPLKCYNVVLFCFDIIQYQFAAMLTKKKEHINCLSESEETAMHQNK